MGPFQNKIDVNNPYFVKIQQIQGALYKLPIKSNIPFNIGNKANMCLLR